MALTEYRMPPDVYAEHGVEYGLSEVVRCVLEKFGEFEALLPAPQKSAVAFRSVEKRSGNLADNYNFFYVVSRLVLIMP